MTKKEELSTSKSITLSDRDFMRIDSAFKFLPLAAAMWCSRCGRITTLHTDCCPRCQSKGLLNIASVLMAEMAPTLEHCVSDRDCNRIASTLRPLHDGIDMACVLNKIEMATRIYCWEVQYENKVRQSGKEMRNNLLRVAECAEQFLLAIDSLAAEAQFQLKARFEAKAHDAAMEMSNLEGDLIAFFARYRTMITTANSRDDEIVKKVVRMLVDSIIRMVRLEQLRYSGLDQFCYSICLLRDAARNFDPRGRPRRFALYSYVTALVVIYVGARGSKPRRRYNSSRPGKAEHLPFFAACLSAAGLNKYPSRIIRRAIEETNFDPKGPEDNVLLDRRLFAAWRAAAGKVDRYPFAHQ